VIHVADTGVGIAAEDQPRIFERFFRADKARSTAAGGVGLGLAICEGLVTRLGGSISFASTLGEGSTFSIRLPLLPKSGLPPDVGAK
jgi:signal transduction histidine kinase